MATRQVLAAIAAWAENWVEVRPEHCDVGLVLSTWCRTSLCREKLPDHRVVIGFEFDQRGRHVRAWMLLNHADTEICNFDPGFGEDLWVEVIDAVTFTRWHLGQISWAQVLRSGAVTMTGTKSLQRALPTWNTGAAGAPTRLTTAAAGTPRAQQAG